jgi:hypothetical protein
MAMTYTDLKTNVEQITEMDFTNAQLSMFTKQVEQRIYGIIKDLPILKKDKTIDFNRAADLPADLLYIHSVFQKSGTGDVNRKALIQKEYDFLYEAYPLSSETVPDDVVEPELKYYALDSSSTEDYLASRMVLTVAPRWNTTVTCIIEYQYQPRSIVDTTGTEEQPWLGTNYDTALLNGVLVEAAKFMKAEPDMIQMYEQQFVLALQQLQNTVDVRLKSDSYRPQKQMPKPIPMPQPTPEQQG